MRKWIFISGLFCSFLVQGQSVYLDSLKAALQKPVSSDTMRVFQYNEIAWSSLDYSMDSTFYYLQKGLYLAKKINYPNGIMDAKNTLGIYYRLNSQYSKAIETYGELAQLRKKHKQTAKLVGVYSNLGSVYYQKGDFALALKNYQKALEIARQFKNKENELILFVNIGVAYKAVGLYDQAVQAFQQGLVLNKELKDEDQDVQLYLNLGTVYHERGMFAQALKYYEIAYDKARSTGNLRVLEPILFNMTIDLRALKKFSETKAKLAVFKEVAQQLDEAAIWRSYYLSLANYYETVKQYDEAIYVIDMAEKYTNQEADLLSYGEVKLTKASIFSNKANLKQAVEQAEMALKAFQETEDLNALIRTYSTLGEIYMKNERYKEAYHFFEKGKELKDQVDLESINNQIATLNALNELDRKEQDLEISRQKNAKIQAENNRKNNLILGLIIIGFLVCVSLALSFRSNREKRKANALLNKKNAEIEEQKAIIINKQTEILDSIHYAKRIQESLLIPDALLKETLPKSFIFFQPKDIVSGDFYWATRKEDKIFIAICDSTGHGVPGAFMSALNITFLSEAINQLGILVPGEILNHVRSRLIDSISHDGAKDGMDGVLFCFDEKTDQITYAAAYNAPVLVRDQQLIKFPTDKMPIGESDFRNGFNTYSIDYKDKDLLYAFTDGYADQFGGEQGKKLKLSNFHAILNDLVNFQIHEHKNRLDTFFHDWKGENDQLDDVCVFGIQLTKKA